MCSTKGSSQESPSSSPKARLRLYQPAVALSEAEQNLNWVSIVFQYMYWGNLEEGKPSWQDGTSLPTPVSYIYPPSPTPRREIPPCVSISRPDFQVWRENTLRLACLFVCFKIHRDWRICTTAGKKSQLECTFILCWKRRLVFIYENPLESHYWSILFILKSKKKNERGGKERGRKEERKEKHLLELLALFSNKQ